MKHDHLSVERKKLLRDFDFETEQAFIAGGAITSVFTNKTIHDFDLYYKSREAFESAVEDAYRKGMWCVAVSGRAITFKYRDSIYQLMCFRWFPTAEDIFDSFDFTACMGAYDLDQERFDLHERFLIDAARRDLVFNHKTAYPLASGLRALKYQQKGYSIDRREWVKLVTAISFQKIGSWEELRDQIGGQYGDQVAMDMSQPFNLENAIESLAAAAMERSAENVAEYQGLEDAEKIDGIPANAEEALAMIFPREFAAQCRKEGANGPRT